MSSGGLVGLLLGCLCACSSTRLTANAPARGGKLPGDPQRYIVAGVDNEAPTPAGHAGSTPRGYDTLTVYGPSARALKQLKTLEHDYGLREVDAWPIAPLHMHCAVLEVPEGTDRNSLLAQMAHDPRVRIAQPLQSFATQSSTYNDPYVDLQRGFQQMDVLDAHQWSRGEGVRVAIIDTGADIRHPDLRGVIARTANFVDGDGGQFLRDRHGTELAGIIAAVANNREGIVGIAPGARLSIFKACWQLQADADAARCNTFTLAQALTAALDEHAQVVNLSLSGPGDPLLTELIHEGLRRGILFIGAAPLDAANPLLAVRGGRDDFLSVEGVIQVAGEGPLGERGMPLRAPGREILTLLPGGRYDFASGASLATAHVTGAVALLLAKNPKLTSASVYELLRNSSTRVANADDSVDACEAVTALIGNGHCRTQQTAESRVRSH